MTQSERNTATVYTCRCQELVSGSEHCEWSGDLSELVVVERMPDSLRASHDAAGNSGVYPHNGAERAAVQWECAARLIEADEEWCREVEVRDVARYAEELQS